MKEKVQQKYLHTVVNIYVYIWVGFCCAGWYIIQNYK